MDHDLKLIVDELVAEINTPTTPTHHSQPTHHLQVFGMRQMSMATISRSEELTKLFQRARMYIQILDAAVHTGTAATPASQSFRQLRHDVTAFLFAVWRLQRQRDWLKFADVAAGLRMLDMQLGSIESMPCIRDVQYDCQIDGNESTSPAHHFLHGNLEWRLMRLSIRVVQFRQRELPDELLTEEIERTVQDLCVLAVAKFQRLKSGNMLYSSTPYVCTCVKELWLLVQLQLESLELGVAGQEGGGAGGGDAASVLKPFWTYVDESLLRLRAGSDVYDEQRRRQIGMRFYVPKRLTPLAETVWTEMAIWLVCGVATVQGFDEDRAFIGAADGRRIRNNYERLERLLRDFLHADTMVSEELLRMVLHAVLPALTKWWPPRTEVLSVLWEYFHAKLNSECCLQGSAASRLAVEKLSVIAYLNQIESRIDSATDVNPNIETSFSLFILILGGILRRSDENQTKKIFGRITSKFSVAKLLTLNETGIHNLSALILTLALTTKLSETGRRLQTMLLQMPLVQLTEPRQVSLARAHVALLLLFTRRQFDVTTYVQKLLEQLAAMRQNGAHEAAVRFLADGFIEIFGAGTGRGRQSFGGGGGEHLLFDAWLPRYLADCSTSERERLFSCVNALLVRSQAVTFALSAAETREQQGVLLAALYAQLLPYVLQAFVRTDAIDGVAELAANLCLACGFAGSAYAFEAVFVQFIEACVRNVQLLAAFLVRILAAEKRPAVNQTRIIQMWITCHICSTRVSEDMRSLTNIVVSLDEFRSMYTADASELTNEMNLMCSFFRAIGQSYQNTSDLQLRNTISSKVHTYLAPFAKYVAAPLRNPENYARIYCMIGMIILHCAPIVYVKGRTACFFNVVMYEHVLPEHVLTGRPQTPLYVQAIHKVWSMLILGIDTLDYRHDQHLMWVLNNLIEKWIPQFQAKQVKPIIGRPFIKCITLCSDEMGAFISAKISTVFFALQRRQPHMHVSLALSIYQEMFTSIKDDDGKLIILLQGSYAILMDHAMMVDESVPSKNHIFEIFDGISKCDSYRQSGELKQIVLAALQTLTKHLAYYSTSYFSFLLRFAKIDQNSVGDSIEFLRSEISKVEFMRGSGRDGKLRNELDKLEGALLAIWCAKLQRDQK